MNLTVRPVETRDAEEWCRMRQQLWPDIDADFAAEIAQYFSGNPLHLAEVLVLERSHHQLGGMIELNIRAYAEGSEHNRVPYIEGWYIDHDLRGQGCGRILMTAAETWARQQGFTELASDAEVSNHHSIQVHKTMGFHETGRIVCLLKPL
ncbi:GNAT family N-acetyltransferase [Gynuella sunshinyii]|uniref:Aminoglycoside N(6')-acetyltransferase type 1 n=1 Tax=Gynuella sunshinyii YC6258 TaxID=1445510 RepID=A0A0C5V1C2_9GAMM|nr:GNAT family N-acetyltransferase [Gynuella sunshinyii]AJQ93310.1 sortase and related acyltransferase [Gynuella sunshinyii YC6258]